MHFNLPQKSSTPKPGKEQQPPTLRLQLLHLRLEGQSHIGHFPSSFSSNNLQLIKISVASPEVRTGPKLRRGDTLKSSESMYIVVSVIVFVYVGAAILVIIVNVAVSVILAVGLSSHSGFHSHCSYRNVI